MDVNIYNVYKNYLLKEHQIKTRGYNKLINQLFETSFFYLSDMDEARKLDGLDLRNYSPYRRDLESNPCSVLEMLIALAVRMDDEWIGTPSENHVNAIFWEMLENLGLNDFKDRHYETYEVNDILQDWMCRDFDYDGEGSIFPLNYPPSDQRDECIWKQMQNYIHENY